MVTAITKTATMPRGTQRIRAFLGLQNAPQMANTKDKNPKSRYTPSFAIKDNSGVLTPSVMA